MQEIGWITRLADADDLRITRLSLTAADERLFAKIWPAMERLNSAAIEGLPDGAMEMLVWTLKRMKTNLDRGNAADQEVA